MTKSFRGTESTIRAYIARAHDNDPAKAFAAYADADGKWTADTVKRFLEAAGVGGVAYRALLASIAVNRLDTDHDGGISFTEFAEEFGDE